MPLAAGLGDHRLGRDARRYCWTSRLGVAEQPASTDVPSSVCPAAPSSCSGAPVGDGEPGAELERRPVVLGAAEGDEDRRVRARARSARPRGRRAPRRRRTPRCSTVPTSPRGTPSPSSGRRPSTSTRSTSSLSASRTRSAPGSRGGEGHAARGDPLARPARCRASVDLARTLAASSAFSVCSAAADAGAARGGWTSRARISSRGGSERASGSASASSCASAASVCGATRIERSGTASSGELGDRALARLLELLLDRRAELVAAGRAGCSSGPAMNVVTSAMITSIANSASEMTPFSSARLSTISSVSPRVFISVPMHGRGAPVEAGRRRAAMQRAERACRRSRRRSGRSVIHHSTGRSSRPMFVFRPV